ncbi:MAG: chromosome partitioning protein ParB, partial [Sphingopyxis sp.]
VWTTLAGFDADEQAALFAHCISFGIDAVWEAATRYNQGRVSARQVAARIEHSHILARAAGLDMVAAGWSATVANYLGRVTKPQILGAVEEACGEEVSSRLAGMKKPEMASAAEELLKGKGWLAKPLRTPDLLVADEPVLEAANDNAAPAISSDEAGETGGDGDIDAVAAE